MADPVKVPVSVAVTLKVIIVFGPAWLGGPEIEAGIKASACGSGCASFSAR